MRGRPTIPTAVKAARGNGKADPIGKRAVKADPKTTPGAPAVPDEIKTDPAALIAWKLFCEEMPFGILTTSDRAALTLLSSTWASLQADAKALGHESVVTINGVPQRTPYFEAYHRHAALVIKLLEFFGLTPSSRAKFAIPKPKEVEADDFADL